MLQVRESFDASGLPAFSSEVIRHVDHELNERVCEASRHGGRGGRDSFGVPNYLWARLCLSEDRRQAKRERELAVSIYSAFAGIVALFDADDRDASPDDCD